MRLGFIGTGRMGQPMARKLVEAGHEVRALTRSQDKRATLAADAKPDDAHFWLQRAIAADPYNEALHRQAADLLDASGDHAAATRLITTFHDRLAAQPHKSG